MEKLTSLLKGKKTYLLLIAYALMVMFVGEDPNSGLVFNGELDAGKIQSALLAGAAMAAKAAFDRFTSK